MTESVKFEPNETPSFLENEEAILELEIKIENAAEILRDRESGHVVIPDPSTARILNKKDERYLSSFCSFPISFIEFAILNEYLNNRYLNPSKDLTITAYGNTDSVGRIYFNGDFNIANSWWFQGQLADMDNIFNFQTKMFLDGRRDIITEFIISLKKGMTDEELSDVYKKVKALAFNNSKYTGKCIKVKLRESNFRGIEIVDIANYSTELILSDVQRRWTNHFVNRVSRGGNARYLLNGKPGTGKTETIREIIRNLVPKVTFVIPDFTTADDLTVILEACEIFDNSVIIMDDIDLYLGSREHGGNINLLGQFLSFFDGVKKRKISLLASTNDKALVDKAAERPGRFNMTIDYTFLTPEQLKGVCQIHLPAKYNIEEVYDVLTSHIDGKAVKITGAFIANLADNIKEMSEDEGENWTIDDAISLIKESYKGFYMSQNPDENNKGIGFIKNY